MTGQWVDQMFSKAIPVLAKWKGIRVKVWDYAPTHRKLTLRVESPISEGNLHIVCGGCWHIRGPFSWDGSDFQMGRLVGGEGAVSLSDDHVGFELHCDILSFEENVEPVYFPRTEVATA